MQVCNGVIKCVAALDVKAGQQVRVRFDGTVIPAGNDPSRALALADAPAGRRVDVALTGLPPVAEDAEVIDYGAPRPEPERWRLPMVLSGTLFGCDLLYRSAADLWRLGRWLMGLHH